jgi:glycosyltransferase involved in cell wall biosynthesis
VADCIWYVSKYVITPSAGDPAGRGYGLMREVARMGHRSVIVTSDSMGKYDAPVAEQPYVIEEHEGITLCRVRTLKYADAKSTRRILSWLDFEGRLLRLPNEALPEPDVIVVSSPSLLTILNGLRLRRKYKARLVFEVRDIWPLTFVEEGGFKARNPFVLGLGAVERLGYRRADAIVGTMPNLGEHVEQVTGQALPTHCIPMGVDVAAIEAPEPLPADYVEAHIPTGNFIVAYAGSLGISNAMDVFFECVESMRQSPDIHFVVLGTGELRQAYVDRYGSLPNLTFAPRVPKAQVHDFLTRCDLLYFSVHNSKVWEYGLSLNKLIDYMLAAKPIVASYSGYFSMINEAECGVFVPAGDALALQEAVLRFAGMNAEARDAIGRPGRNWLLSNRDYRTLARDYLAVLVPGESAMTQ